MEENNRRNNRRATSDILMSFLPVIAVISLQFIVIFGGVAAYYIIRIITGDLSPDLHMMAEDLLSDFTGSIWYELIQLFTFFLYLPIFGCWYYFQFARRRRKEGIRGETPGVLSIVFLMIMGFAIQVALAGLLSVILPMFPKVMENYTALMDSVDSGGIITALSVGFFAPLGEELIFRGLILRMLKRSLPMWGAITIQALLFGIYHMNIVQGCYAFLIGLIFGRIACRYDSFLPSTVLHISINLSSYLMVAVIPDSVAEDEKVLAAMILIALFVISAVMINLLDDGRNRGLQRNG